MVGILFKMYLTLAQSTIVTPENPPSSRAQCALEQVLTSTGTISCFYGNVARGS